MLHPLALGSLATLIANDHVGKALVTGKLSDAAGIVLLPRMLAWLGVPLPVAIGVAGVGFGLVKVWAPANTAWNALLAWPHAFAGVGVRMDPWDLVVLPLALVWLPPWGRR